MLSLVDKVTTATWCFASVIQNVCTWLSLALATIKQFADKVRIRLIWQLMNGVSKVFRKLQMF